MRIRVVLQARMSSVRLPAKVLLPIAGIPLAILCAKRIMRQGMDFVLATSDQQSDDALVSEAEKYHIPVVRGSLSHVLDRYVEAVKDLDDDDLLVRVTADNPVVDADFIQSMIGVFHQKNGDYLGTLSPVDGLPYGLSAEVMTVDALRKARQYADSPYQTEHVTPWIRDHLKACIVEGDKITGQKDLSYLRCTVDSFDDYTIIHKVFLADRVDAIHSSWKVVIEELKASTEMPTFSIPHSSQTGSVNSVLALGTVQLGLDYGIANQTGMPDSIDAINMVRQAIKHGVNWIDTARGYGLSEQRVGESLSGGWMSRVRVVTKLDPLVDINESTAVSCLINTVQRSVFESMHALRTDRLDVLLLHRWSHRKLQQGKVWEILLHLKDRKLIRELGASIYTVEEAIEALSDSDISHLQIPFNLLDHRWLGADFQRALSDRPDVRIHVRSAFLQGLLISDAEIWPDWDVEATARVEQIKALVLKLGRSNRADLCMAYIRAYDWINSIVIGVETCEQLVDNFRLACEKPLTKQQASVVVENMSDVPVRLIDPSQW